MSVADKQGSTPTPWSRGLRDQISKNGRFRPRISFILGFSVLRPWSQKGPDHGVGVDPETLNLCFCVSLFKRTRSEWSARWSSETAAATSQWPSHVGGCCPAPSKGGGHLRMQFWPPPTPKLGARKGTETFGTYLLTRNYFESNSLRTRLRNFWRKLHPQILLVREAFPEIRRENRNLSKQNIPRAIFPE